MPELGLGLRLVQRAARLIIQKEERHQGGAPRLERPRDFRAVVAEVIRQHMREDRREEHAVKAVIRMGKSKLLRSYRAVFMVVKIGDVDMLETEVGVPGRDVLPAPRYDLRDDVKAIVVRASGIP